MNFSQKLSVIIATRNKSQNLAKLLESLLNQSCPPCEIIIIDDSTTSSTREIIDLFDPKFKSISCEFNHVNRGTDGLTSARNLGVEISRGDLILFLDDDTILEPNLVSNLVDFIENNSTAWGVQPRIIPLTNNQTKNSIIGKLENCIHKALMLSFQTKNKLVVRRSGASIFPVNLKNTISVQRLSGCCCCYKREVFKEFRFDTNLKRWGTMEDLDFSYRIFLRNSKALYAIPNAKIIHKVSGESRFSTKLRSQMETIYWFYIFFKDIFHCSIINLMTFFFALFGNLVVKTGGLIIKRKPKQDWWGLIHLLRSYVIAIKNLKNIKMGNLEFFNKQL